MSDGPPIDQLSPEQRRERLKQALRRQVGRPRTAPVSFAQQRLWFLSQFEEPNPSYNIACHVRLRGRLDAAALERSLNEIVRRHEALRTTFRSEGGKPVEVVAPELTVPLRRANLAEMSQAAQRREIRRLITEEAGRLFDVGRGPLVRAKLLCLDRSEHLLVLTMHHIVSDGWSMGVLVRELATHYEAFRRGRPSPMPRLPIQYPDYAAWQRDWLTDERVAELMAYWRPRLEHLEELDLPADRPRPPVQRFQGSSRPIRIPKSVSDRVEALSRQEGVTPYITLLAAFVALLHRYTGQDDVVVGAPSANRNRTEIEGLIGFFVNMLVIRTGLEGDPSFRELLGRVRERVTGAHANQDLPFETLVEQLQPERDPSRNPLFQVSFTVQNAPIGSSRLPDLFISAPTFPGYDICEFEVDTATTRFDLEVNLWEKPDGMSGAWAFSTDLFDAATIDRMIGHYLVLLEAAVADPAQPVSRLPLMSGAERDRVVGQWSRAENGYACDKTIHELFEQQVVRLPDAAAVICDGRAMTYGELNARANQLAHHLCGFGVGPDDLVAVYTDRSHEMVVALLGVLKAGAAYVALDPTVPRERVSLILNDAASPVILTQEHLAGQLPEHGAEVVRFEADSSRIAAQSKENPAARTTLDNLAYVIYTSGSTGEPKGVLITHGNVTRLFKATEAWFHFDESDVWTMFHSYAFDFSVWELWGALLYGGRVVIVPHLVSRSPELFYELLSSERVTVLNQTPSAFDQLLAADRRLAESLPLSLRLIVFGGEALDLGKLKPWFERHGDQRPRLVNMYGITETTVHVTYRPITTEDVDRGAGSVIGRPIPDLKVCLLDKHRRPVPVGVPGEIYVGGAGVGRGYLNRPQLTAERFVADPLSGDAAPVYRSGDLARWLDDGDLEYLGRIDHQVQIRGFRVELGEIEAVLSRHPAVREAVVVAREDQPGHQRLVAYVVPRGEAPSTADWRRFLKARLPDYMVPSAFVPLDAMPLSASGKVDRKALPEPKPTRTEDDGEFAAPRNAVERTLADIWSGVLKLDRVGINDSFFELGGDSILVLQVAARAAQSGIRFKVDQMFRHQTIAGLAAHVSFSPKETVVADQRPVAGFAPMTPVAKWFFEEHPVDPHHFNQTMLLDLRQDVSPGVMERAVKAVMEHHDALRLRCARDAGGWRQEHLAPEAVAAFGVVDLSEVDADGRNAMIEKKTAELQRSFSLAAGPLVRFLLFDLGEDRPGRLLIAAHHLVIDGVSWRILLEDLQHACLRLREGRPVSLPEKTASFKRWAELLAEEAQSDATRRETDYWLSLAWERAGPLPADFQAPDEANTVASADTITVELEPDETVALLQEVPAAYQTQINEVLLTALAQAMQSWTGHDAVAVHLEGHGRESLFEDVNLARTVGWFTSIFPVVLDLTGAGGPGEAIKSIKEQLRRIPRRGIGYGLLRYLRDDPTTRAGLERLPQAQIRFNYLGRFGEIFDVSTLFRPVAESISLARSPRMIRPHDLEIDGMIVDGRLKFSWTFSTAVHRADTIARPAGRFIEALQALVDHCRSPAAGGYTPSDFPQAEISQEELDMLSADIDDERELG